MKNGTTVTVGKKSFAAMDERLSAVCDDVLKPRPEGAFAATDIARVKRCDIIKARTLIRRLVREGAARRIGYFNGVDSTGRWLSMPHFILTQKNKTKK